VGLRPMNENSGGEAEFFVGCATGCPLWRAKRTLRIYVAMSVVDPKQKISRACPPRHEGALARVSRKPY
jgi:hypothetical protein